MFTIDKLSRTPIYEQLIAQFEYGILSGEIAPDGKLPSVRELSQELCVNPNTLQRAFNEIENRAFSVNASCGAVVFRLNGLSTIEECIRKSDEAMYREKEKHHAGRSE